MQQLNCKPFLQGSVVGKDKENKKVLAQPTKKEDNHSMHFQ